MAQIKHHNAFIYYTKYKSFSVSLTKYLLKNDLKVFFFFSAEHE